MVVVTNIVFLDDFLKASVVKLGELGQVVHISNDVTQILFQEREVVLDSGIFFFGRPTATNLATSPRPSSFQATNDLIDFFLAGSDSSDNLSRLHPLEGPDLVEFALQLCDKSFLVIFIPRAPLRVWVLGCGSILVGCLKGSLQILVGDVVIEVFLQE